MTRCSEAVMLSRMVSSKRTKAINDWTNYTGSIVRKEGNEENHPVPIPFFNPTPGHLNRSLKSKSAIPMGVRQIAL